MPDENFKISFLWHMKKRYVRVIEKIVNVGGRFQRAAADHEDRKRRGKDKGAFKRLSEEEDKKG